LQVRAQTQLRLEVHKQRRTFLKCLLQPFESRVSLSGTHGPPRSKAKRRHPASSSSPRTCSGDTVPIAAPGLVRCGSSSSVAPSIVAADARLCGICLARPNENLRLAALGDEDIGGLDIAVDDALRVRRVQRVGHPRGQVQPHSEAQRPAGNPLLKCLPLQEFHGDEAMAVVLADFADRADVRMVQCRGCAGFAEKAFEGLLVARNLAGKKLQRDSAAERDVLSFLDHPIPPPPSFLMTR
jgi:hypothetical protein